MKKTGYILLITVAVFLLGACTSYDFDQADTEANQAGFERHFGFPTPESVSELYYFADEIGVDVKYQIGFKTDQATVEQIIAALSLEQQDLSFGIGFGLVQDFDWWPVTGIENLQPYWNGTPEDDYYWILWYDTATQSVYYLEFSL